MGADGQNKGNNMDKKGKKSESSAFVFTEHLKNPAQI